MLLVVYVFRFDCCVVRSVHHNGFIETLTHFPLLPFLLLLKIYPFSFRDIPALRSQSYQQRYKHSVRMDTVQHLPINNLVWYSMGILHIQLDGGGHSGVVFILVVNYITIIRMY